MYTGLEVREMEKLRGQRKFNIIDWRVRMRRKRNRGQVFKHLVSPVGKLKLILSHLWISSTRE